MHTILFLRGVVVGLVLALPVGPVAVICIRRALANGGTVAFLTCQGAALADAILGVVAGYGLSMVSTFLISEKLLLRIVGGVFLIALGIYTYRAASKMKDQEMSQRGLVRDFIAVFLLSVTNPATLVSAAGTSAAVGSLGSRTVSDIATLAVGIFLGSTAWWLLLAGGAGILRSRLSPQWLVGLNHAIGVILLVCGAIILGGSLISPQNWAYLLR